MSLQQGPQNPQSPKGKISFEPVESTGEARRILSDCARSVATAQLFTRKRASVLACRFVRLDDGSQALGFRPDRPEELRAFLQELVSTGSSDLFVNVVNDRVKVFFRAPVRGIRDGKLVLTMPEEVFRVQRREHARYKIPQGHTLRALIRTPQGEPLNPKVLDFSAGGMALLIPREQAQLFQAEQRIPLLQFVLNRQTIECEAQIRHVRPTQIDGHDVSVVGVVFQKLRVDHQKLIYDYVRRQTRAMLSRLL